MDSNAYYDFTSLAALKSKATYHKEETSKPVLEKFEALFIDQMLQSMRKATVRSDLFDSQGVKLYESLFDKEISEELAKGGGLGLRKELEEQLKMAEFSEDRSPENKMGNFLERREGPYTIDRVKAMSVYSQNELKD